MKNKISLRHIILLDSKCFFEAEQDEDAKKNFMSTPQNIDDVKNSIRAEILEYKKVKPNSEKFTIIYDGDSAGWIKISDLNIQHFEHKAKIDFCLHPDFRGKKIMIDVINFLTDYAFKKYKLVRIEAWCRDFNIGSQKVLKKAGFKYEGTLMKNKFKNGIYLNDMIFAKVI